MLHFFQNQPRDRVVLVASHWSSLLNYRVTFLTGAPLKITSFFESQTTCDFEGGSRVEKKDSKKKLSYFPSRAPFQNHKCPPAPSYPAAKVLSPATSVWGLVGGSRSPISSWDYKFFSIAPLKSQVFKEYLLLPPNKPHTEVVGDSTFAAG